jgi:hypothetical protein
VAALYSKFITPYVKATATNAETKLPGDLRLPLPGESVHDDFKSYYLCIWSHPGREKNKSDAHRVNPGHDFQVYFHRPIVYLHAYNTHGLLGGWT